MRGWFWLAALVVAMAVAGRAGSGRYPIGRAAAGPDDPVLGMPVPVLPAMPVAG